MASKPFTPEEIAEFKKSTKCWICHLEFEDYKVLIEHINEFHQEYFIKNFKNASKTSQPICPVCGCGFDKRSVFLHHLQFGHPDFHQFYLMVLKMYEDHIANIARKSPGISSYVGEGGPVTPVKEIIIPNQPSASTTHEVITLDDDGNGETTSSRITVNKSFRVLKKPGICRKNPIRRVKNPNSSVIITHEVITLADDDQPKTGENLIPLEQPVQKQKQKIQCKIKTAASTEMEELMENDKTEKKQYRSFLPHKYETVNGEKRLLCYFECGLSFAKTEKPYRHYKKAHREELKKVPFFPQRS